TKSLSRYIFLILLFFIATFHIQNLKLMPLEGYDEVNFIQRAEVSSWPLPDWAPLYVFFQKFLFLIFHNPIQVYYANHILMVSSVSLCIYLLLYKLKAPLLSQLLIPIITLLIGINFLTLVKVNHFNFTLITLLLTFTISKNFKLSNKMLISSIGLLLLCYVRQDNLVPSILLGFSGLFIHHRSGLSLNHTSIKRYFSILIVILIGITQYSPFNSERSFSPFKANLAKYINNQTHDKQNKKVIINKSFSTQDSFTNFFKSNPKLIIEYLFSNFSFWIFQLKDLLTFHYPLIYVPRDFFLSTLIDYIIWGIMLVLLKVVYCKNKIFFPRNISITENEKYLTYILVVFFIKTSITISLYGSLVTRYSFEIVILFLFYSLYFLFKIIFEKKFLNSKGIIIIVSIILLLTYIVRLNSLSSDISKYYLPIQRQLKENIQVVSTYTSPNERQSIFSLDYISTYLNDRPKALLTPFNIPEGCLVLCEDASVSNVFQTFEKSKIDLIILDNLTISALIEVFGLKDFNEFTSKIPENHFFKKYSSKEITIWQRR
ncbi:MAG: hypothetical protein KDD45_05000, partial [Bdellovibrionales bacterium]|nr:hypothetical protein [Bdellovibrionales bacterium]